MGLDSAAVKFLCAAKSSGVDFQSTLTIGRQGLIAKPYVLQKVFATHHVGLDPATFLRENQYGDAYFSLLGATEMHALDKSPYEGATVIHDMNQPTPSHLRNRYSMVYDGGSLEHVFNVPQALKNCMDMVRVGGHFLQVTVANNFLGHGFWQLSPELMFRVFSPSNGFRVEAVLLHEVLPEKRWSCRNERWYAVNEPNARLERVELCNCFSTYMLTIARKVADADVFATTPQQGDYAAMWEQHAREQGRSPVSQAASNTHRFRLRRYVPGWIKDAVKSAVRVGSVVRPRNPFDRPYFTCIHERDLLRGKVT